MSSEFEVNIPAVIREDWEDESKVCTVVQALSGFGKTSVYRALAEESEHVVWLTADLSDSDTDHFLRKMEQAWEQIDEATMDKLSGSEKEGVWDRVDNLVERTYHWSDRWIVVWDDAQMLGKESRELLIFFIKRLGSYIHFILLTDSELPPEIRSLIRRDDAILFTGNDLRIVRDDVICRSFLGWPLGVNMATTYVERRKTADIDLHILLRETGLAQVIEDVMWNALSEEEKDLFVQTAALEEFSWEMCDAVTDHSASRHIFEKMISKTCMVERARSTTGPAPVENLMYQADDGDEAPEQSGTVGLQSGQPAVDEWYRFGDAYATFLRERIPENKKREIYGRAALWCRSVGDHAGMVNYAIDGHRTELLTEVMEKEGTRLLAGRQALGRIIHYLEEEGVAFSTTAAGIAGQYYYAEGNMGRMEEYLNAADSAFGRENRYSAYRSLYRALDRYDSDPDRYEKQLRNAMFFLRENELPMPWLNPETEERLERLLRAGESGERTLRVETM
ncbi:MAG: hypothetical protein J5819_05035, partial [Eubacterium sp.]|nr:hypothetical protein [Eubacterium sp.]